MVDRVKNMFDTERKFINAADKNLTCDTLTLNCGALKKKNSVNGHVDPIAEV